MTVDDEACIVEFKLLLAGLAEDHVRRRLASAAHGQGRRLPKHASNLLRTGALAAVARLEAHELADFARGEDWPESMRHAVESGAWARLLASTVRFAFDADAT